VNSEKYIGLDVHQATIPVAVMDSAWQVGNGIHPRDESGDDSSVLCRTTGTLWVTFEEGTCAAWLN
jgi:hypothetical protein